ncbi:MAG: MoaD/ThiS family protein [Chloroflexota bacterium]|nr:MoaD/ThiS family protein [Chloroflexota bacterium]
MNQITIKLFATLRDHIGEREIRLDLPQNTRVRDLKPILTARYPAAAASIEAALVSVNHEYALPKKQIPAGAEVALFPHVSGG